MRQKVALNRALEAKAGMKKTAIFGLAITSLLASTAISKAAVLESPAHGAVLSGIGFISGWKCDANNITVVIDENGEHLSVAMHQERADLRLVCGGTIRHGFVKQFNWALLGDGEHVAVAYDDGLEFARATFTVGSTGEEFLTDVSHRTVLDGFPSPGERAVLQWNESTQHFEIVTVWGMALDGEYDRSYWRRFTEDQKTRAFTTDEELYAELPALSRCFAGRLSQAAKNRALEAANQIRALHGLTPLVYSTVYGQQVQEAALIQAVNGFPGHQVDPSADCYTVEGAEGSWTSNLFGGAGNRDPADHMVGWANDFNSRSFVESVGHRRALLDPFEFYFVYGQVYGYAAHKTFGFDREPRRTVQPEVDFVAFPYQVDPYHLVEGDPPWSFSVIEHTDVPWKNRFDYFQEATITVTRAEDGTELPITNRYAATLGGGLPNVLSWKVTHWQYDTLYEVEIENVIFSDGLRSSYAYSVFIERDNLEE